MTQRHVKPLYMFDGEVVEHQATVLKIGSSEIGKKLFHWIELDETVFHPKGGGQPSDEGMIEGIKVAHIHKEVLDKNRLDQFSIFHCFLPEQGLQLKEGSRVILKVDPVLRKYHSQLHTAGHLVAEAINTHFPDLVAYQGNHYPNEAFVRFKINVPTLNYSKEALIEKGKNQIQQWIDADLSVLSTFLPNGNRAVKISQEWAPCGGTHLKNLKELPHVTISDVSINTKDNIVTVKYNIS